MASQKAKVEDLVGRHLILQYPDGTRRIGTVYTSNNLDYEFVYRKFENCIASIFLEEGDLEIKGDHHVKLTRERGTRFYHGGKSPYSMSDKKDSEYKPILRFIQQAASGKR